MEDKRPDIVVVKHKISFAHNLNFKLFSKNFVEIRPYSDKYKKGEKYKMEYNGYSSLIECVDYCRIDIKSTPDFIFYLAFGKNRENALSYMASIYGDLAQYKWGMATFQQVNLDY